VTACAFESSVATTLLVKFGQPERSQTASPPVAFVAAHHSLATWQMEKPLSYMLGFLRMPRLILYAPLTLLLLVACANAQTECRPSEASGFMVSWANEPGIPDHSEIQSLSKGTLLVCIAVAESGTPGCRVKLQKDREYSLPPHNAIRTPKDDLVSLTCKGSGMRCCKVQVTPDSSPLKKDDTKPRPQKD
jgi:hypothetical protein